MSDADAVGRALDDATAVVHTAAVVSLEKARAAEVLAANPAGTRIVVEAALDRAIDPVIYVSSTASVFRRGLTSLHTDLPPAELASAYGRSKAVAETWVRARQDEGAPIVITYPASVLGPPAGRPPARCRPRWPPTCRWAGCPCPGPDGRWWTCATWRPCTWPRSSRAGGRAATCAAAPT